MKGNVFQTLAESKNRQQFLKTVEALERYSNKKLKHLGDLQHLFQMHELPTLKSPGDITDSEAKNPAKLLIWQEGMKSYLKREQVLKDNLRDLFSVIWGQCSTSIQSSIRQEDSYEEKKTDADCGWLLREIKCIIFKFASKKQKFSVPHRC